MGVVNGLAGDLLGALQLDASDGLGVAFTQLGCALVGQVAGQLGHLGLAVLQLTLQLLVVDGHAVGDLDGLRTLILGLGERGPGLDQLATVAADETECGQDDGENSDDVTVHVMSSSKIDTGLYSCLAGMPYIKHNLC